MAAPPHGLHVSLFSGTSRRRLCLSHRFQPLHRKHQPHRLPPRPLQVTSHIVREVSGSLAGVKVGLAHIFSER